MMRTARLTLSNAITATRLLAVPFFYCAIVSEAWLPAFALFWLAVVTDVLDGRVARARGEVSAFGGLLDHASDATFVSLGLIGLAMAGQVSFALPALVVAAFLQYVLDSRSLEGRTLRASFLGRWNGVLYFVPVGTIVTREALGLSWPGDGFVLGMGWLLVITTLLSIVDRAWTLLSTRSDAG
ncbi:MAG: CDP-alcohol phosphatidyltransferase family protein [Myxococcota bacterium]